MKAGTETRAGRRFGATLAAGLTAGLVSAALASAGTSGNADSFSGSCSFHGTSTFTPPATIVLRPLGVSYDGPGSCTGILDGRAVSNTPIKVHDAGPANPGSCLEARTAAPWPGAITFADGTTVRFTLEFAFLLTEGNVTFRGERSGTAHGHGTFVTPRTNPIDVISRCGGAGGGAKALPLDITLTTDNPLVTERALRGNPPPTSSGGPIASLRLSVRPRRVTVNRRTTFAFQVATSDGRPAPGAIIRFAAKRAHTGLTGAARIVTTLHRSGGWKALATEPGFRAAKLTIIAHPR